MVHPAELRRRDQRAAEAQRMTQAAAELRAHGQADDRFAGLDPDSADAAAALLEVIAGGARDTVHAHQWQLALRLTSYILQPAGPDVPGRPLPAGYENPYIEQARHDPTRR